MIRPAVAALAVLALVPATASADTYCVQKPGCTGTDVPAGLQAALSAASNHAGADRVEIGPTASPLLGTFSYTANEPLDIVGAGIGVSRLAEPNSAYNPALVINGPAKVTVSDLSVELPALDGARGLYLGKTVEAERVEVKGVAGTLNAMGIYGGGSVRDSKITLPDVSNLGVSMDTDGGLLENTVIDAGVGVRASTKDATVTVRGVRISSSSAGLLSLLGTLRADDVVVDAHGPVATGLYAGDYNVNPGVVTLDARHVTVRTDNAKAYGVSAYNSSPGESAVVHLRDSVVTGPGHPIVRGAFKGSASVDTDYSAYPPVPPADSTGAGALTESHRVAAAPQLDAVTLLPLAGSPLIDAGTPGPLAAGERTTDAADQPRFVAGGGCDARRDVGALEFQPTTLTATANAPATARTGEAVAYTAAGSCDPDPLATLTYDWAFDDGTSAAGASVDHVWSTSGTHVATLTVHGGGSRSGTATASVDLTAPPKADPAPTPSVTPSPSPTVTPTATPARDRTAPVLTRLGRRAFTLSEPAKVVLKLRRGHGKARTLTVTAPAGRSRFRLRARRPGRYRLVATPTDAAGNHGKAVSIRFRVRR